MAYTASPENQTYSSHSIPLAYDFNVRPGNTMNYPFAPMWGQDAGIVNGLLYKDGNELKSVTRPAIVGVGLTVGGSGSVARGMYVWEKTAGTTYYFVVVDDAVFSTAGDPLDPLSWAVVTTLSTAATTPVRFTEFIDSTNVKKLVLVDGVEGYVYTSNAAGTKITDVDFPSPHIPWPVFLDGYLFLAKAGTGDIYNSDLDNPANWTAGSYISTETFPDDIQALVKVQNYLMAVGTQSCEFFYDAANATASPLARYAEALLPFGCQFPNSIAVNKDTVVMLANSNEGQSSFKVIEGFKYADIPSTGILNAYSGRLNNPYTSISSHSTAPAACRGYLFRHQGNLYYGFLADGVRGGSWDVPSINVAFAYSFNAKAWSELQFGMDVTTRENRWAFPVAFTGGNTTGSSNTMACGHYGASGYVFFGKLSDQTAVDYLNQDVGSDVTLNIYQEFRTPNITFGTNNLKAGHRLGLNVETTQVVGSSTTFYVAWNDYDYEDSVWQVFTPRTLTIAAVSDKNVFPFITQLGSFRRRAYKIYTNSGVVIRTGSVEFDINKGQQ